MTKEETNGVEDNSQKSPDVEADELTDEEQFPSDDEETRVNSLSRRKKAELERQKEFSEMKARLEALESKETEQKELAEMVESLNLGDDTDKFKQEYAELVANGLSKDKAKETALKMIDQTNRNFGKSGASLPPTSTVDQSSVVYTKQQLEQLSQAEYDKAMNAIERGKAVLK